MTILVFGGNGQVGQELLRALAPLGKVVATTRSGVLPDGSISEVADFNEPASLSAFLDRIRPSMVLNAAAYTAVDRAEQDSEAAWRANAEAPRVIAHWCAQTDVPVVHYSTDYVFDGKGVRPYREDDVTAPLGVYGRSKLAGEEAIRAAGGHHLIFRTAWVYAAQGSNFLRTMLRVGAERDVLRVVADQTGTPTAASLIADVTAQVIQTRACPPGIWNLTARGQTTWHGFAQAIYAEAVNTGMLAQAPHVQAITTADYPTPARRPTYSTLDVTKLEAHLGVTLPDWRDGLKQVMRHLR